MLLVGVKIMMKEPPVLPLQTIVYSSETYIVSQVRICRKCKFTLAVTDGNHRLYFDKEKRIALHEHIICPELGYFGHTRTVIPPQGKEKFLFSHWK